MNSLFKAILETNDEGVVSSSDLNDCKKRFRQCCYFDKWYIGSQLVKKFHLSFKKNAQFSEMRKTPMEGIADLIDLLLQSGNILAILELVSLSIPVFRTWEQQAKKRSMEKDTSQDTKSAASTAQKSIVQYSRNVGLVLTGILKLCHEYTLLEYDLCCKIFTAYQKVSRSIYICCVITTGSLIIADASGRTIVVAHFTVLTI